MEQLQWILQPLPLYFVALVGMFTHFLKKQIKGESILDIADYFKLHFKSTILAFVATTIGYFGYQFLLASGQKADIFGIFAVGYMFDSTFNRWDNKETKVDETV